LYPGGSDKIGSHKEPGVHYLIDVYSPLSWRQAADQIIAAKCDVAILSWWTLFWQPGFAYIARRLKRRGVKIIFLCHNLSDHGSVGVKHRVSEALLKQADGYIVHAKEQAQTLAALKPLAPVLQRLHPIYNHFPPPTKVKQKRGRLEILFFGFIRPYKGLDSLVKAVALTADPKIYLTVVGEPWQNADVLRKQLTQMGAQNLELHLQYVDEQSAANYFARADAVALPYLSATGSGVVALAYHYKKPVLATKVGGLSDAIMQGKTGWLVKPGSPQKLANAINNIRREQAQAMAVNIERFNKNNSWQQMAEEIQKFATKLLY
jgi:glycosyltransferase involved in cell wall biosynthesis